MFLARNNHSHKFGPLPAKAIDTWEHQRIYLTLDTQPLDDLLQIGQILIKNFSHYMAENASQGKGASKKQSDPILHNLMFEFCMHTEEIETQIYDFKKMVLSQQALEAESVILTLPKGNSEDLLSLNDINIYNNSNFFMANSYNEAIPRVVKIIHTFDRLGVEAILTTEARKIIYRLLKQKEILEQILKRDHALFVEKSKKAPEQKDRSIDQAYFCNLAKRLPTVAWGKTGRIPPQEFPDCCVFKVKIGDQICTWNVEWSNDLQNLEDGLQALQPFTKKEVAFAQKLVKQTKENYRIATEAVLSLGRYPSITVTISTEKSHTLGKPATDEIDPGKRLLYLYWAKNAAFQSADEMNQICDLLKTVPIKNREILDANSWLQRIKSDLTQEIDSIGKSLREESLGLKIELKESAAPTMAAVTPETKKASPQEAQRKDSSLCFFSMCCGKKTKKPRILLKSEPDRLLAPKPTL